MRVALALVSLVVACANPRPHEALLRAERLERAGQVDEAARSYDELLADCDERRKCAEYRLRKGQLYESAHRNDEAVQTYTTIDDSAAGTPEAARALDRIARIWHEAGDQKSAQGMDMRIIGSYPNEVAAEDALERIVRRLGQRPRELIELLGALHEQLADREIADDLLFAGARSAKTLGDTQLEMELHSVLADKHLHSGLRDDALWRMAEIHREQGDFRGAVLTYERILATRRDALLVGSYHSQYLDDAQLEVGLIYLDELGDSGKAREKLLGLRDDMEWSLLRDDAQYHLARASRKSGKVDRACQELAELPKRFPDSNQLRKAKRLGEEMGCHGH